MSLFSWLSGKVNKNSVADSELPEAVQIDTRDLILQNLESNDEYWWNRIQSRLPDDNSSNIIDADDNIDGLRKRLSSGKFKLIEIPSNINQIMELLRKQNYDYQTLENHLKSSPVMTGEVLRIANSALFAGKTPVTTLADAFPRLGEERLISILYIGLTRMFVSDHDKLISVTEDIVNHSYTVANIASLLAEKYNYNPEEAYLAGLLDDIGKIAILCDLSENTHIVDMHDDISVSAFKFSIR